MISFLEKRKWSILERLPSSSRMRAREETGGHNVPPPRKLVKTIKR